MKPWKSAIFPLLAASFLASCATPLDPAITQSAEYNAGYTHGCTTASRQSNGFQSEIVEDKALMGKDEAYTMGWRQGFYGCGGSRIDTRGYSSNEWYTDIGD